MLNKPDENAFVLGTTIYIHWGLIDSEYLGPVLAHELGHLNHGDGRLMLALRRFVPPPLSYIPMERIGCLALPLMAFGGGAGLMLMTPLWNRHWQRREFLADRFAYECGQAVGLIEFLELYEFFDVAVPFGFLRRSHPHSAARTDKLNQYLREEGVGAPRARLESAGRQPQSFTDELSPEEERQVQERKRGYTDAEAFLDLVFLAESHGGDGDPTRIAAEKTWIRQNGRRVVDLASVGRIEHGAGFIFMIWLGERRPERQYIDGAFNYDSHALFSDFLDAPWFQSEIDLDSAVKDNWLRIGETHDPEQSVVVMIINWNRDAGRYNADFYLVGLPGGAPLPNSSNSSLGSL